MTEPWVNRLDRSFSPLNSARKPIARPKPTARKTRLQDLIERYRQWISERTQSGDYEFLPASLEILERPPSPLTFVLLNTICALVTAAFIWSWIGHVDVLAVGTGRLQPIGGTLPVQSINPGSVIRILAVNGQSVRAGQTLVQLAPQSAQADLRQAQAMATSFAAEVARRRIELSIANRTLQEFRQKPMLKGALLQDPHAKALRLPADGDRNLSVSSVLARISDQEIAAEPEAIAAANTEQDRSAFQADLAHLKSQIQESEARLAAKQMEVSDISQALKSQQLAVNTLASRVDMRSKMFDAGVGSKADLLDATEAMQQQQSLLEQQTLQFNQAQKDLDPIRSEIFDALDEFAATDAEKLNDAQRQADSYRQEVTKASAAFDHATLRSPVDGVVESSTIKAGQVVGAGEQLMEIVPNRSALEVQCWIPNSEIGFVRVGQRAIVKVDAYPFTEYGLLEGVVTRVASDSVADPADGAPKPIASAGDALTRSQNVSYFPVTVRLTQPALSGSGASVKPSSGMSVSVEIKTGSRRLIEYLLSPLSRGVSESLRER